MSERVMSGMKRRDVAIVSFAKNVVDRSNLDDTELLLPVINAAVEASGVPRREIGFTVSGSCDFVGGRPFSFVMAIDAIGAWPPIEESHVEMDGAFALYEAWLRLQHGDIDAALVYAFGKGSQGRFDDILALQQDPYTVAPLWPDATSMAALQARALLDSGKHTERDFAAVAKRGTDRSIEQLLAAPYVASPLRAHDCGPWNDGVAAMVLVAGDLARSVNKRPAYIRGIDHRIEPHHLGLRDLTRSTSTERAAERAGLFETPVDVAELHAPFSHQELILRSALRLGDDVKINPSGGALANNPPMVAGLLRTGEAATAIMNGADRALAHATSGACLQQNLVCVLGA